MTANTFISSFGAALQAYLAGLRAYYGLLHTCINITGQNGRGQWLGFIRGILLHQSSIFIFIIAIAH